VTAAVETPKENSEVARIEAAARTTANTHVAVERAKYVLPAFIGTWGLSRALDQAQESLAASSSEDPAVGKASEWFLDNYYLVRRVARQVAAELPRGFARHLPRLLSGPAKGSPRVEALARALIATTTIEIDANILRRFVIAYQEVLPLTIAELWALPTMLRAELLRALVHFLRELDILDREPPQTENDGIRLEPAMGVERSIRTLRLLADIDWMAFFETASGTESILRMDPAGVYARMDFATCDSYRKAVEDLSWVARATEEDVAARAIALARAGAPDERRGHVGYYLVDAGRDALERQIAYRYEGMDRVRRYLRRWPTFLLLSSLAILTAVPLAVVRWYLARCGGHALSITLGIALAAVPASVVAVTIVQWAVARLLPPRSLPKLDFSKGVPDDARTLVVIPTLLGRAEDVAGMLRQIELHYLSNPDPRLQFALLTDDVDSDTMPHASALLESAAQGIASLNARHGREGAGPFHLLHRESRWNPNEGRFMGWERKRGKIEELNRLLRGSKNTSYARHVGDPAKLDGIRFVVTLDSDTELPIGSVHRMIGLLSHPLNRPVFDAETGRVVSGYTIAQPRIETSASSARHTRFSKIFSGDVGFDIYTHATSDLYQDLFGSGIYVGKGIYDVDAFLQSLGGRVPENSIASHDLFEGIHARTALASDIVLFEEYPSHFIAYARRMHRWVRGDWQLLPWLFPKVPSARGERLRNPITLIDRWKIIDNLRRSLVSPLFFALLVSGWTWLPGNPWVWTCGALALLLLPILPGLVNAGPRRVENFARGCLALAFLAHEALVVVDAIGRVLARMAWTHKRLLQWTSAAHTARRLNGSLHRLFWREMLPSLLVSAACTALVVSLRPKALLPAVPILGLWLVAPELACWVSQSVSPRVEPVSLGERRKLRRLARRTWLFFETLVGPNDQWLPIDNYQEEPREQIAHRTSPTNVGMFLLSLLSAYDLGYLGPSELSLRLKRSFESIARLPHYQGHILNWCDTKTLEPLLPRYVSTVDSGNFAGCLLALRQGCLGVARAPIRREEAWDGLDDSVDLLEEVVAQTEEALVGPLRPIILKMRQGLQEGRDHPESAHATLRTLCGDTLAELDRRLLALLEAGVYRHEAQTLHALRTWMDRIRHQLQEMLRELELLLPWLGLKDEPAARGLELPISCRLDEIPDASQRLLAELEKWERDLRQRGELSLDLGASAGRLRAAFQSASTNAGALKNELFEIAARAGAEMSGMDFRLLFDRERKLFHIGYNVTLDQIDPHHYDLLASEARLASYLAIVKGDVPESHWYALGRPMTRIAGGPALLSWGGTMFEYLMPSLLMQSQEGTLLAQSCRRAVEAQIAYGERNGTPWGVSESAYARLDAHQTYQYQSFGVPGLGFKRGLEDDLVFAPYASVLAVSLQPRAVLENLATLESMGMVGTYGLFEALDLRPERMPDLVPERVHDGRPFAVVRSYMAHHQGMLFVALNNFLNDRVMVNRFHADLTIETGEMLLNERTPTVAPTEWPIAKSPGGDANVIRETASNAPAPWSPHGTGRPEAMMLSNGRLTSVLTDSGGGGLRWQGLALTSYRADPTCDEDGLWIYLRDEDSGRVWLATSEHGRTTYAVHKAEFHRREQGISVRVDVTVAPADDVEVRQITVHNETDRPRRLTLTSAAEPLLLSTEDAARAPAFSKLFIESELVTELDALVFARHLRSAKEECAVLVHRLVREGPSVTLFGYETDRAAFFGRCENRRRPRSLSVDRGPLHGRVGAVLDAVASLMAGVELGPNATVTLAFVTTVGRSRGAALELARRYGSMHAVRWAFRDAEQESLRRLQRVGVDAELVPTVQRLFSALLFADRALRAPPEVLAAGRACKSRLWGRRISGDDPIVFVRVYDARAPLLGETIAAQRYLRSCGVRVDLVLLDEQASGYLTLGSGTLRGVLAHLEVDDWLNRRGGIYVLAADQVSEEERRRLEASARVLLDTRDGSLSSRLARTAEIHPRLPRFEPTLASDGVSRPALLPKLLFENGTGGFTEDGREYVISIGPQKITPAPWCNVLANSEFGCLVSESSLGSTWSLNSGENRLTPWRNDPVFDLPSEALYLRDEETALVWSPTPLPAGRDADTVVRHGAGYTTYKQDSHGLEQELAVFVPPDVPLKIVRLRLKNTLSRNRRVTATYYVEWVLGTLREEQRAYIVQEFDEQHACLRATCSWNAEFAGRVAFLASELQAHGFATDRTEFLGRNGDYARPEALERWGLSGRIEAGVDPCAAIQVHLELGPGEQIETHFVLGQASNPEEALQLVTRFRDRSSIDGAWDALHAFWDKLLGNIRVKTPEPAMDLMLNRWLLYQSISSRLFGRTAFYQSSGAFGYRDQLQDVVALVHVAPERTRAHILEAAAHQFEEGDVLHWWHPPSGRGVRTRCSDDLLWLPFVTEEYVRATGDAAILSEVVPFLTGNPLRREEHDRYAQYEASAHPVPLFEHCRRALERGATQGRHGLPLMGDGDWNDGMNRVGAEGRGESVWLGWFLYATMDRFAALCDRVEKGPEASAWRGRAESLRSTIEATAWDGAWYLRAFHDDGSLVGSAKGRECCIDSIAQAWAVISGAAGKERAELALHTADEKLVREDDRLVLLLWPPFESTLHDPGYIRAYPPGIRENGGQYTHAATWLGWAYAALGNGERAERIFRLLNPILRTRTGEDTQRYRVEPYVLAGDVYSTSPCVGRGGWTWYTGAAAWAWRLGVEAILGLHMEEGQLRVDPCIPPGWKQFEAWLGTGDHLLHIVVENPEAVSTGVASLILDGVALDSNRIPLRSVTTGPRQLRVRLGSSTVRAGRLLSASADRATSTPSEAGGLPHL
jgi:cyclic beta-1,2-glucan synthetase